ncbi:hypothetical protein YDYSG_14980 [Paenibacillus tyrfis]|uniref:PBP1A family penicillin-binding protein n=1 Tax=Paenibacillus tyrfis TaxID=1501230 RepID=UPI00248F4A43|nr:PBP1A family penicillin-binding protein [Paenibacillus tyrfis]GLI05468.1 hypothetical protein YDYSG_14980 [Paenibacillus tyrfis]
MTGRNSRTPGQAPKEKKPTSSAKSSVKPKKKKKITIGKVLAWTFVTGALAAICGMGVYIFVLVNGDKIVEENIDKLNFSEASIIYDAAGNEAGVLKVENRENVDPAEVPEILKQAFIATEDQRFEQHQGVDLFSVGRALVKDVVARSMVEGGSTITQQLAKNVFLSSDKTFFRKATEMSIALALEKKKTKDEIITYYLNRIYFGNRAYGVKAASKVYFGVSNLKDLKLWQVATLAAMPKAPNTYNPISNPDKSKDRRAVVLKLMQEQGYITEAQRAEAVAAEYAPPVNTGKSQYQTYIDYVLKEAQDMYKFDEDDLLRGGYKIYTSLDPNAQQIMEQTYANDKLFQKDGPEQKMQSSMVILNNEDGGIVAMIGGRDYVARGLNRAVAQPRQPGSAFKTLVAYAPAIESGKYNPYSRLPDVQKSYNGYSPRNYDGVYRGEVSMFDAVKKSMNLPAVDLLSQIGVKTGIDFVKKLGIDLDEKNDRNLAIALGGLNKGVTTLQMARAYSAFPNNGNLPTAHAITKIVGDDGKITPFKGETKSVMSAKTAWYMTQLMQGVVEPGGTGAAAKFDRPLAAKTGTTQLDLKGLEKYNRDLWFVGYTPEWTAAVWLGFDKTDSKHYVTMGSGSPGIIFKEVMQKALAKRPMTSFKRPDGVKDLTAPPKGITDLKAEHIVMGGNSKVELNWSGVGDNMTYQIFRKDSKMADFPAEPLESTTMTEFSDRLITQPDTYEYVVVPYNPENNTTGARSNVATVKVDALGGNPLDPLHPGTDPNGKLDPNSPGGKPGTNPPGTGQPGNGDPGTGLPDQGQRPDQEGGNGTDGRPDTEQGTKPGTGQSGSTRPGGETSQPGGSNGTGAGTGRPGTDSGAGTDTRTGTNGTNPASGTNSGTQTNSGKGHGTSGTSGGKNGSGTGSSTDAGAGGSFRGGSGAAAGTTGSGASTGTTDGAGTDSASAGSTTQTGR